MTSTHKHHIISIQYPSHKCLPEKSCLHCLRILVMSWLFKDPVVIMKKIMPWLLRIQLTVAWLNLIMLNQTVKNSLKAKKIKLPQMIVFCSRKTTNEIFMYLSAPFILQNFYQKNLRVDSELWGCAPFLGRKQPICPEQNIFWCKTLLLLSSTYGPFHCAKFKRNLTMDPELWRCIIFGPKVVHLPEIYISIFSENLLMSLVSFIHTYLHAKNWSQILIYLWNTDDLWILKSHWLRATFVFTWELDFS